MVLHFLIHIFTGVERIVKPELTDEERFGVYFSLQVIKMRDGAVLKNDKELVASQLNTSLRTVERIWKDALDQIARGEKVDVSNKKKGNVGRKRKDLDLSRIPTIPLNRRRTIRGLARSLGVCPSTLYSRFEWGELRRHTSSLKPGLTEVHKIKRLKFCMSMLDPTCTSGEEAFCPRPLVPAVARAATKGPATSPFNRRVVWQQRSWAVRTL